MTTQSIVSNNQMTTDWVVANDFVYTPKFGNHGVWGREIGSIDGIPVFVAHEGGEDVDHVHMSEVRGMQGQCGSRTGIIVGGIQCIAGVWYVKRVRIGQAARRVVFASQGKIVAQAFNVRSIVRAAKKVGR